MNCLTFAVWYWWNWGGKIKWSMHGAPIPHFYVDHVEDNYIAYYNTSRYLKWWQMLHYDGDYSIEYNNGW